MLKKNIRKIGNAQQVETLKIRPFKKKKKNYVLKLNILKC